MPRILILEPYLPTGQALTIILERGGMGGDVVTDRARDPGSPATP
jgi:hypothetical protein